jgi:hypothetical protein
MKKILLWNNKHVGVPLLPVRDGLRTPLIDLRCPVHNCAITNDRSQLNDSDYILFNIRSAIDKFPTHRLSHQKWTYVVYESQQYCPMCVKLDGLFNVSATFSRSSAISSIYLTNAQLVWSNSTSETRGSSLDEIYRGKTGFAAILVSDCHTNPRRLEYVNELKKYISVDVYGKCSTLRCPPEPVNCREFLANKYLFFLAFENSLCNDYITEK